MRCREMEKERASSNPLHRSATWALRNDRIDQQPTLLLKELVNKARFTELLQVPSAGSVKCLAVEKTAAECGRAPALPQLLGETVADIPSDPRGAVRITHQPEALGRLAVNVQGRLGHKPLQRNELALGLQQLTSPADSHDVRCVWPHESVPQRKRGLRRECERHERVTRVGRWAGSGPVGVGDERAERQVPYLRGDCGDRVEERKSDGLDREAKAKQIQPPLARGGEVDPGGGAWTQIVVHAATLTGMHREAGS